MLGWLLGWLFVIGMAVLYLGGSYALIYKMSQGIWPWEYEDSDHSDHEHEDDKPEEGWNEEDD